MTTNDPIERLIQLVLLSNVAVEAAASVALDGDTQSIPEPNAILFRTLPSGEVESVRVYDARMPALGGAT